MVFRPIGLCSNFMITVKNQFALLLLVLFFASCNTESGKNNQNKTRKTTADTVTRYFPENYEIIKEDSLIDENEGVRIVIQREVLMDKFVTLTYELDSFNIEKDIYRDYASTIMLYRHDTLVCRQTFTKADFPQIGDDDFYKKAITHNTWLTNFDNTKKTVQFSHVISVPETDWAYDFTITLSDSCKFKSELEDIE